MLQILDENDKKVIETEISEVKKETESLKEDLNTKIIKGANLFNKNELVSGFYTTSVQKVQRSENNTYKCLLLDVEPGKTYTATGWGYTFSFYNEEDVRDTVNKVGSSTQSTDTVTFTVPNNAVKMSVNIKVGTNDEDTYMIVEGSSIPDEYIPFEYELYASTYIKEKDIEKKIQGHARSDSLHRHPTSGYLLEVVLP